MPFLPAQHSVMPAQLDEQPTPAPTVESVDPGMVLLRCPVDGCRVVLELPMPPLQPNPLIEDEAMRLKEAMIRGSEELAEQFRNALDTHGQARHDPAEFAAAIAAASG